MVGNICHFRRFFYRFSRVKAVYEGKPVTMIENNGFSSYTNMTSVRIPGRITGIGSNAFPNCTGLTSVMIPNNVTSIGQQAFYDGSGLTGVTFRGRLLPAGFSLYAFYRPNGTINEWGVH